MKGGFYGVRSKQISLILITLVCTTILLWAWDKTPFLTSLLPPQGNRLQLSNDILVGDPTVISSAPEQQVPIAGNDPVNGSISGGMQEKAAEVSPEISETNVTKEHHENEEVLLNKDRTNGQENVSFSVEATSPTESSTDDKHRAKESSDLAAPVPSNDTSTSFEVQENVNSTTSSEKQVCNLAKGKWVVDNNRPLYSGFGCQQWLSGMWACRLTQRMDFDYELLRWQPKDCVIEEFTGTKFLERMRNKTLAFVGDSLGRQQFQSLMCMVSGGKEMPEVLDVGREYGLVKHRGSIRPDGWAYRFPTTSTTILYYWSASLCDLEPIDPKNRATDVAMHLDRPPAFLQRYIHKFDVLVLNTGHHWNRGKLNANHWVMHVGGVRNTNMKIADIAGAKNFTIHSIIHWVDSQLPKYPGLKAFYRSLSPRHFFNGDWNTGGTCDNTSPLASGKEVLKDESSDSIASRAVEGTNVKFLDITALSELRDEGHISRYSLKATPGMQDCLHWCLPGVPDTWNEILFAQI